MVASQPPTRRAKQKQNNWPLHLAVNGVEVDRLLSDWKRRARFTLLHPLGCSFLAFLHPVPKRPCSEGGRSPWRTALWKLSSKRCENVDFTAEQRHNVIALTRNWLIITVRIVLAVTFSLLTVILMHRLNEKH